MRAPLGLLLVLLCACRRDPDGLRVGSKAFTESIVLAELALASLRGAGLPATHRRAIGGTQVLWNALVRGELDVYPDYTGTLAEEIFGGVLQGETALEQALASRGIRMTGPLGFDNTYAVGMRESEAERLGIRTLSDLAAHPELRLAFSNEFMDRKDGWPRLRERYGMTQRDVRGVDHDLAYRSLARGTIAATDLYSTDAEIRYYHLRVLKDDRHAFPDYRAVLLYRADLERRAPDAVSALASLEGRIPAAAMTQMNARVKLERVTETRAAAEFLERAAKLPEPDSMARRIADRTEEHLLLVAISLGAAIVLGAPLGVLAARRARVGQLVLGIVGVVQTIPSLALLVFMIPLLGIGAPPAIVALSLYSLLPIVRNTYAGLQSIAPGLLESADALGLSRRARLFAVELPIASRSILAGIKTSAVINVGTATLGALIGAGGYGQPILTGIRLDDARLILMGAVPAALLALLVQALFDGIERLLVPKGLRLQARRTR